MRDTSVNIGLARKEGTHWVHSSSPRVRALRQSSAKISDPQKSYRVCRLNVSFGLIRRSVRGAHIRRRDSLEAAQRAMSSETVLDIIPTASSGTPSKASGVDKHVRRGVTRRLSGPLTELFIEIHREESDRSTTAHGSVGLVRCKKKNPQGRPQSIMSTVRGRRPEVRTDRAVCSHKESDGCGQVQGVQRRSTEVRSEDNVQLRVSRRRPWSSGFHVILNGVESSFASRPKC
jgi:hypothetical protein